MLNISRKYNTHADEELMQQAAAGHTAAFDELYSRYGQKMFSFFFRMLWKNKELAEDFTHDLFIKLIRQPTAFDASRSFSTWLYSLANNMCKNEYRKMETRSRAQVSATAETVNAKSPDLRRFNEAVQRLTNELPEEKKTLYLLRFQENLSIPEISQVLDIAEGTVKSRIFYLLKQMKEGLRDFENLLTYP